MSEILSPTHRSPQMPTLLWHTEQLTTNSYFEWRNAIDTGPHWLSPNYFTTILADENRTRLLLKLLKERGNGVFRTYAERASSIGLGYYSDFNLDYDDLKDHLDELAGYCPNIVEISCARVNTQFSDFQNFKRLDKLNFFGVSQDRQAGSDSFSLSITRLSIQYTQLPPLLNPASFPFLRHLSYDCGSDNCLRSILPLLPRIASLTIGNAWFLSQINRMLSASTSLTSFSIPSSDFAHLDDGSCNVFKELLEVITIQAGRGRIDFSKLSECIAGSKVLKKVILDGLALTTGSGETNEIADLKIVVEACKEKKSVELWKENFTVNGKVDLNADVATSFDLVSVRSMGV